MTDAQVSNLQEQNDLIKADVQVKLLDAISKRIANETNETQRDLLNATFNDLVQQACTEARH